MLRRFRLGRIHWKLDQVRFVLMELMDRLRGANRSRWIFVSSTEDWILKGICQEIQRHGNLIALNYARATNLPRADYYFFAHPSHLIHFLHSPLPHGRCVVLFPHFEDHGRRRAEDVLVALRQADKIVCLAHYWEDWLVERGLQQRNVRCVLGGADPRLFQYHERRGTTVGFVSRHYPRKRPEIIHAIVEKMPETNFILLGARWEEYSGFKALSSLPNFRYIQSNYRNYPAVYNQMDVLVSPSRVEGGPIPVLEAMMCNIVPVASRTGFAPDVIQHGVNGYLFDVQADVQTIIPLIRDAFTLRTNVRATVEHLTWERFSRELLAFVYDEACPPESC